MADNTLEFLESYTVDQFKAMKKINEIKVVENPKTGKLFFTFGFHKEDLGPVSSKGIPEHPMISRVKGTPTPDNPTGEFYLLHDDSQRANVKAVF